MALRVQATTPPSARVVISPAAKINVDIGRFTMEPINLEDLKNVDHTTNGLETGQAVIYDEVTQTWITSPLADEHNPDGGTY